MILFVLEIRFELVVDAKNGIIHKSPHGQFLCGVAGKKKPSALALFFFRNKNTLQPRALDASAVKKALALVRLLFVPRFGVDCDDDLVTAAVNAEESNNDSWLLGAIRLGKLTGHPVDRIVRVCQPLVEPLLAIHGIHDGLHGAPFY